MFLHRRLVEPRRDPSRFLRYRSSFPPLSASSTGERQVGVTPCRAVRVTVEPPPSRAWTAVAVVAAKSGARAGVRRGCGGRRRHHRRRCCRCGILTPPGAPSLLVFFALPSFLPFSDGTAVTLIGSEARIRCESEGKQLLSLRRSHSLGASALYRNSPEYHPP